MLTTWTTIPMFDHLLIDVMNDVTGTAFGSKTQSARAAFQPAIDVRASDEELVFVCDVPGLREEDLEITIDNDTLTLRGHRSYDGQTNDKVWLGRSYGSFTRSFTLPPAIDREQMTASLASGVLTVPVPQLAQARSRRIPIGGGTTANKQLEET